MNSRLHYDLVSAQSAGDRLTITVPQTVWQRVESDKTQADNIADLSSNRTHALSIESNLESYVLSLNDKRIGASQLPRRDRLTRGVCVLLAALNKCADDDEKDPLFEADLGISQISNTGRYSLFL